MVLHASGQYGKSIDVLQEAEKLSEHLDVVSVSEETKTFLVNERERAYRGEDFEKLMISVIQALNYTEQGQEDDALVEVRRVNQRLQKMKVEEKKPYEQLAIARYLGGVLWENQRDWDAALIDYAEAYRLQPSLEGLAEPLIRLAALTHREDDLENYRAAFPQLVAPPLTREEGQIVVLVEAGYSPEKMSKSYRDGAGELIPIPVYVGRWRSTRAWVSLDGENAQPAVTLTSLDEVAKVHLQDRVGRMIARGLASTAVKAGISTGVGMLTQSEGLGYLSFFLLNLGNRTDLRSWLSLPAEFQLARLKTTPGTHQIAMAFEGTNVFRSVEVKSGRITLVVIRQY